MINSGRQWAAAAPSALQRLPAILTRTRSPPRAPVGGGAPTKTTGATSPRPRQSSLLATTAVTAVASSAPRFFATTAVAGMDRHDDGAASQGGKGKGRGGGGRGNRRGGGSGDGGSREVTVSRALSKLLRHQAERAGIGLDGEGYAALDEVLIYGPIRSLKLTLAEVQEIVASSDKQRFSLKPKDAAAAETATTSPADWLIRANQGHSIKLESAGLLRPITLDAAAAVDNNDNNTAGPAPIPPTVVHGTYFAFWRAIEEAGGLKPMGRNHVHCGTGVPGGDGGNDDGPPVVSGMRRDAELLVYVDVEASLRDGAMKWWLSDNGVVLTEGDADGLVPARYFREVVGRDPGLVGVLWRDGQKVADLPPGLKFKVPVGKERVGRGSGRGRRGGGRGGGGRGGGSSAAAE